MATLWIAYHPLDAEKECWKHIPECSVYNKDKKVLFGRLCSMSVCIFILTKKDTKGRFYGKVSNLKFVLFGSVILAFQHGDKRATSTNRQDLSRMMTPSILSFCLNYKPRKTPNFGRSWFLNSTVAAHPGGASTETQSTTKAFWWFGMHPHHKLCDKALLEPLGYSIPGADGNVCHARLSSGSAGLNETLKWSPAPLKIRNMSDSSRGLVCKRDAWSILVLNVPSAFIFLSLCTA